jgi:hypothetical protein
LCLRYQHDKINPNYPNEVRMNYYAEGGQARGLKALAQELPKYGRYNDDMVAHISSDEAALLKAMGGAGTTNPATGLPEFGIFGIGGGGGILGTGINKNASDPISNTLSNNPISQGISKGFQGASNFIDQGLVGLDKVVGKTIPGGWGTLGMAAASFVPGMTPAMMGGLGGLTGSGVLRKGGNFNLQGAIMGGAMAYGAANLSSGLQSAGGGGAEAVANAAGGTAPGAATAEGIASQIASQTGTAVSAAPGSQAAMLAAQVADMGVAGANNVASALTAPTTGVGIGSQLMAGNFGNAMNQIGQNISGGFNNAVASGQNLLGKATTGSTYEDLARGYGQNLKAAGRGITNLSGLGDGGLQGAKEAAKAFAGSGATMSNTLVPIAVGGMGLQAIEEQRNALQDQLNANAISQGEYNTKLAEIERQATVARNAVASNPFSTNPNRTYQKQDTLYGSPSEDETLYTKSPSSEATLYATGGAVNAPDDQTRMPGGSPMTNFTPNSLGILSQTSAAQTMQSTAQTPYNTYSSAGYSGPSGSSGLGSVGGSSNGAFPLEGQYGIVKMAAGGMTPRFLSGGGDGMSDDIPARIEGKQEARLADGEFVVPADVVSHLGNGSSKAGAKRLYSMMDKVRHARTGNKKQGKQINPDEFLAV